MLRLHALKLSFLALVALAPAAWAGPPGFAFLEVPAGARGAALGGAYSALAQGVEAAFWNPAGLAGIRQTQFTATHVESFEGLKHDQFALGGQWKGGGIAASLRAMYSQPIEERDEIGTLVGSFGSHDLEFQVGFGHHVGRSASFGLALQSIRERIANEAAMTWSAGAGAAWAPAHWNGVRLSLAGQHLGPSAHYVINGQRGAPVRLPASVQGGASWHHALGTGLGLDAVLEGRGTSGRQVIVSTGGELSTDFGAALRLGVRSGDDVAMFSAGVGYRIGLIGVDYAWVPSRLDLGDTHRFSFGAQF